LTNHFFNITQLIFPNLKLRKKLKKRQYEHFTENIQVVYANIICGFYKVIDQNCKVEDIYIIF